MYLFSCLLMENLLLIFNPHPQITSFKPIYFVITRIYSIMFFYFIYLDSPYEEKFSFQVSCQHS